jgi:hypothetical protein
MRRLRREGGQKERVDGAGRFAEQHERESEGRERRGEREAKRGSKTVSELEQR